MTIELKAGATAIDPVYICHGAEHDLKIAAVADSPWINQGVSFNQIPGESSPISTDPEFGRYQNLLAMGGEWKLNCPAEGKNIDFSLQLQSEFSAVPFQLSFKLGHYRREILNSRDPISSPVIGDEVSAEIQVGSFYTQKVLIGVDVEWYFDGKVVRTEPTTSLGWSRFDHTVSTSGMHTITAKVHSPYDDSTVEQNFTINVYSESPWEQATLLINGEAFVWNSPIAFLYRGQTNEVKVAVPFLEGSEVLLDLDNSDDVVIEAAPKFGEWVSTPDGRAVWVLTAGSTRSGRITLKLSSRDVSQVWEIPCAVLSADLLDEADVKIDGHAVPPDGNWFYRDKAQTVTFIPKMGSPLDGLPVTLNCEIKSGLDVSDVVSTPIFGNEQTTYNWSVIGKTRSGTFELTLLVKGIATPITLAISKLISSNIADEADVKIDGLPVPPEGNWFFREIPKTLTLTPVPGSPLAGVPFTLSCVIGSGLDVSNVVSEPAFGSEQTVYSWIVTGSTNSGTFQLIMLIKGMPTPITLAVSRLISSNITDEAVVKVGGLPVSIEGNLFFREKPQTIALTPKSGSPLSGLPVTLICAIESGLDVTDVVSAPAFDSEQKTYNWEVTGKNKSGTFQLSFKFSGVEIAPFSLPISKLMSISLDDEAQVQVDGEVVATPTLFLRGQPRTVTLIPKGTSPIGDVKVVLEPGSPGRVPLLSVPGFGGGQINHSWEVTASQISDRFSLRLMGEGMRDPIEVFCCVLSDKLGDEAFVEVGGVRLEENRQVNIRTTPTLVKLVPKAGSPLELFPAWLQCGEGDQTLVTSEPRFLAKHHNFNWNVRGGSAGETVSLFVYVEGVPVPITIAPVLILQ
jgi:hypothetical protein